MHFTFETVVITVEEGDELEKMTRSWALPAADLFQERVVLMLAEGLPYRTIQAGARYNCGDHLPLEGSILEGAYSRTDGGSPSWKKAVRNTPALTAKVIGATRRQPKDGPTRWPCRKLAQSLGVSKDSVQRIWQRAVLIAS
jgi:hypothetical protein